MIATLGVVKLSILLFYRRIFNVSKKSLFNILSLMVIAVLVLWTLGFMLAFAFNCKLHFFAMWGSQAELMKYCNTGFGGEQAIVITDFITDLMVLCFPLPMVFRLHLPWPKKLGLLGIFLLGWTCVSLRPSLIR